MKASHYLRGFTVLVNGNTEKGSSLLEYIAVLMIAGLLFAANPLGASLLSGLKLKQCAGEIVRLLDRYSDEARRYDSRFTFQFNREASAVRVLRESIAGSRLVHSQNLPSGITIETVRSGAAGPAEGITLYSSGSASPSAIVLRNSSGTCTVIQALRGARRVECIP